MSVNQQPFSRSIKLPSTQVAAGTGLTQLSNAAGAISQALNERITDVAVSEAAQLGAEDVENNATPDSLARPFTKATKAYNQAVTDTESARLLQSAHTMISESLINNQNSATFTRETPAKFNSEIEGIKSGILQNARPENREHIRQGLDKLTAQASLNMLQHSINFDNQQIKFDFTKDITGLLEERRNAAVAGDTAALANIDAALQSSVSNYSTMNAEIARKAPYLIQDIQKHRLIDDVLGGYAEALHDKTTGKFLSNLAENKDNLPFTVWNDAVKAVVALDQTEKRLKNDVNAVQVEQVSLGIENGSIQNAGDIANYNELTVPQTLSFMRKLDAKQAKEFSQGNELITAQQNILNGRPEFNSASTRDKMFKSQIQSLEQSTGKPATLVDMSQSVLGKNAFPASGLPGTGVGTNVPAFDSVMQGKLTGGDIMSTAQAALVYNDMVETQGKPNSINLTGDALAVATLFSTLNQGGTTPEQAAELAINTVINAKEPQIEERATRFHRTLEHVNPYNGFSPLQNKFKDAFGTTPAVFKSDEAFNVFKNTYRAFYLSSNSEEAAEKATKQTMLAWGKSKYFDDGMVGNPVPEKELPITQVGNAFPNQIVANLQGLINRTKTARESNPKLAIPVIEWADAKQTITGNESEEDKVFKKFTLGDKPRIKIDGQETDVVLIPSPSSRLGNRINYVLGVYDKFNNLHPLEDPTNRIDGAARFMPQDLNTWSPKVANAKSNELLREAASNVLAEEKKQDAYELDRASPNWQTNFGLKNPKEYLKHIDTFFDEGGLDDTFKAENSPDDEVRLNQIISSLKGGEATNNAINNADNVGISPSLGGKK